MEMEVGCMSSYERVFDGGGCWLYHQWCEITDQRERETEKTPPAVPVVAVDSVGVRDGEEGTVRFVRS